MRQIHQIMKWVLSVLGCAAFLCSQKLHADLDDFANPGASASNADYQFTGKLGIDCYGNPDYEFAGYSVAGIGDVDADGIKDILIGAPFWECKGEGRIHLVLGSSFLGTSGTYDLELISYKNNGASTIEYSGYEVSEAGDIEGDGYSDFLVGQRGMGGSGQALLGLGYDFVTAGAVIISARYTPDNQDIPQEVAGGGDVDGDGLSDFLVGVADPPAKGNYKGKTYLFLSSSGVTSSMDLSMADSIFEGENADDHSGFQIDMGDIDADGLSDMLISAPGSDSGGASDTGAAYIVLGSSVTSGTTNLSSANLILTGENADDFAGYSVDVMNDLDGDGYSEILIGSTRNDAGWTDAGAVYLVLGSTAVAASSPFSLSSADLKLIGGSSDYNGGFDVGSADVDGDGLGDILIGAPGDTVTGTYTGTVYVFLGSSIADIINSGSTVADFSDADYIINGENADDRFGWSVSSAKDVDGDGLDDILIGAPGYDGGGMVSGKTYLILAVNECDPDDAIYVDGYSGTSSGPGGPECPYDTIQGGIDAAVAAGLTRVVVWGWFYYEDVVLETGIELVGELRWGFWMPFIINSGGSAYLVEGANEAALKNFVVCEGSIKLDGVNEMTIQENVVYNHTNLYLPDLSFENGASDNVIENNIFYQRHYGGGMIAFPQYVIYLGQNSDNNLFLNNTIHSRDYYGIGKYDDVIGVYLEDYTEENEFRNNIINTITHYSTTGLRYGFYTTGTHVTATIDYNKTPANNLGVTMGTGNVVSAAEPRFVSPMPYGFNYTLQATSMCINAGDPDTAYNDPDGTRNDMGAFGGVNYLDFQ